MKKYLKSAVLFSAGFGVCFLLFISLGTSKEESSMPEGVVETGEYPQDYKILTPEIPSSLNFAGETVPLDEFEVYERIEREILVNTYWHSATLLTFKRASRWFPLIEPILKKNNIPDDFKFIAAIESGLANVVSPAKAVGFWQLLEEPAEKYGLEVNDEVDERYDVEMATLAACRYLREAYNKFGNWTLAAASYNMGMTGVARQLERQKADSYYNLVLGEETSRYIARAVAMKLIFSNPAKYGFAVGSENLYKPLIWNTVELSGKDLNLADYAFSQGINYKELKYYNPWLRDNTLKNKSGRTYKIKIPAEGVPVK